MSDFASTGVDPDIKKFLKFMGFIVSAATYWTLRAMGVPPLALLLLFLSLAAFGLVGWVIGRVLSHYVDGDGRGSQIAAWSILVVWFIPPLGVALAAAVGQLAEVASRRKYLLKGLSSIGVYASMVNAALGVLRASGAH